MVQRRPNRVTGPDHDEFWMYCDHAELRIQRCEACRHLSWPPAGACERCGSPQLAWELLSGRGRVVSWCTFERRYYQELDVPWDTILVELDEGPLFISNPSGFTNGDVEQGLPVRVAFVDCEDDAGRFRLPVFEQAMMQE
ncbi:MAG: OB-fold domain-containing protein [Acidimicrobiaceae bacterium]|nr:OB-fold domain-containing protein [Acidimicrobiaceae bacterium]